MSLDRDELAARCLVARLSALNAADAYRADADAIAENAIDCTDALLARLRPEAVAPAAPATEPRRTVGAVVRDGTLRHYDEDDLLIVVADDPAACQRFLDNPRRDLSLADAYPEDEFVRWATREECERHGIPYVARPLPGAPLAAPSRPEWVRIMGPDDAEKVTVGNVYAVRSHSSDGTPNTITNDRGEEWYICLPGYKPSRTWPSWEPCAAPSPAASPAPYVPKVGDVVHGLYGDDTLARITYVALNGKTGRASGFGRNQIPDSFVAFTDDTRPATPAERAAAGLPVDEAKESATKPVDREGLARAIYEAVRAGNMLMGAKPWESVGNLAKNDSFNAADAAIAFMAKGPAFDRADFNEAQEREAAKVAVSRDAGDDFTRGWIARARVAAKGGAS